MQGMTQQDRERAVAIIRELAPKATIYLFGARERNDCEPCADARIALDDNGHTVREDLIRQLHQRLNDAPFAYSFDVYDFNRMDQEDRNKIKNHGVRLA